MNSKDKPKASVSLRPSDMVKSSPPLPPPSSADDRIHCKTSIHKFKAMLHKCARGHGLAAVTCSLSAQVVEEGWVDEQLKHLTKLCYLTEDIELEEDDFCLDSVLGQLKTFSPGETDGELTIRVGSGAVKEGLYAQATICGIYPTMYVQLRITELILRSKQRSFGKSQYGLERAVTRLHQWLDFREKQLEFVVQQFGKSSVPE